ncbi:MAG TPA: hypothetical protein VID29_06215 [Solirubrobacteraceae bacterium]
MSLLSIRPLSRRRRAPLARGLGLAAACAVALPASVAADGAAPAARAARTLSVNDTAHLRVSSRGGSNLIEEGQATGSLPGRVRASLLLGAGTVKAGFTIYLRGGSISGHGSARLNAGRGAYASFGGSLVVSHGTGRYAHVSGSGGLYGTINRENDNAVVQVVGNLHM